MSGNRWCVVWTCVIPVLIVIMSGDSLIGELLNVGWRGKEPDRHFLKVDEPDLLEVAAVLKITEQGRIPADLVDDGVSPGQDRAEEPGGICRISHIDRAQVLSLKGLNLFPLATHVSAGHGAADH